MYYIYSQSFCPMKYIITPIFGCFPTFFEGIKTLEKQKRKKTDRISYFPYFCVNY